MKGFNSRWIYIDEISDFSKPEPTLWDKVYGLQDLTWQEKVQIITSDDRALQDAYHWYSLIKANEVLGNLRQAEVARKKLKKSKK